MMDDERYARKTTIPSGEGYPLMPGGFILAFTVQKVSIPHDCRIAARVKGKSSLARIGLGVHITAPLSTRGLARKTACPYFPFNSKSSTWGLGKYI